VNQLASAVYCAGSPIEVPFTASGTYSADNVFTLQLSDENGTFGSDVLVIGTAATYASGTITTAIPHGMKTGSNYRVRIVSSSPAVTGEASVTALQINTNVPPAKPTISREGNTLISSRSAGNQWYLNGAAIEGATQQAYTPVTSGIYAVQIINTCAASALSETVDVTLASPGTESHLEVPAVKVGPNPANGYFVVTLPSNWHLKRTEIYHLSGKPVWENTFNGEEQAVIDVQQLPKGMYMLKIETQKGFVYRRIVLQ
jgi:hypothetical protein